MRHRSQETLRQIEAERRRRAGKAKTAKRRDQQAKASRRTNRGQR
jgi:hypothetical protein